MAKKLLRPAEAAERLGVNYTTLYRWANEGKIKFSTTAGGHRRYAEREIRRLADDGGTWLITSDPEPQESAEEVRASVQRVADGKPDTAMELLAAIMQQNQKDYSSTTQSLIEGYQRDIANLQGELETIRSLVISACTGKFTPSPDYIMTCLWPDPETVEQTLSKDARDR